MLIKLYCASPDGAKGRYSPAESTGIKKTASKARPIWRMSARHLPSAKT
jgi:hypothetical protein